MAQPKFTRTDERNLERVVPVCPVPDDGSVNASWAITWDGEEVDYIEKTMNGETWRQTYTYAGGVVTAISAWVEQ